MTQETTQAQTPALAEKPAQAGTAEQPKGHPRAKKAVVELTDADLQAVNGGGSKPGIMSGSNAHEGGDVRAQRGCGESCNS